MMKTFTKTCESVTMLKASQKTLILRLLKEFNEFFPKTRTKDNGDDNVTVDNTEINLTIS